jgi:hypothetical protein
MEKKITLLDWIGTALLGIVLGCMLAYGLLA